MAKTQVSITYGEKTLDCELSFEPPYHLYQHTNYNPNDCEFTLESVSIVCTIMKMRTCESITHTEDITSLIFNENMWEDIEEKSVNTIMERGYV